MELASIAGTTGNPDEAERLYRSIVDGKKQKLSAATTGQAKLQLSRFYLSAGKLTEALEILQKLCADSLQLPQEILQQALLDLGKNYLAQNDFKKVG